MVRRPKRTRLAAWSATLAMLTVTLASTVPSASADTPQPPSGQITPLPNPVPNYFAEANPTTNPTYCTSICPETDKTVSVFADPANHLLFETDIFASAPTSMHCPGAVPKPLLALDSDTFQPLAYGCGGTPPTGSLVSTNSPLVAVDSADHLLFFSGNESSWASTATVNGSGLAADTIVAVSEATMRPVADWTLPSITAGGQNAGGPAPLSVLGLSWQAVGDRLVVETGYDGNVGHQAGGFTTFPTGVDVAVYDIAATMSKATAFSVPVPAAATSQSYPYNVSQCAYAMSLQATFATADPLLGADGAHLFVPCHPSGSFLVARTHGALPSAIVRLDLTNAAPTGSSTVTALPGNADGDVVFDAASQRAFVPVQTNSGTIVYVYDGTLGRLVGEDAVVSVVAGQANPDFNCVDLAMNGETGRVYGLGPSGLFDFDGRLTSVGGGQNAAELANFVQYQTDAVLPSDDVYPYPRVILNTLTPTDATHQANPCQAGTDGWTEQLTVFADRTDAATDVTNDQPDANTYDGDLPAGYGQSVTYGTSASASGAHVDWAGGFGGAANNVDDGAFVNGDFVPFGGGIRDLLAGWVQGAGLTNGSPAATATPMGDGSGPIESDLATCTDLSAPFSCQHPAAPDGTPAPPASTGLPRTAQAWPFGVASCPIPTANGEQDHTDANGLLVTTSYDSNGDPQQQALPGSDQGAAADVNCAPSSPAGGVTADASSHLMSSSSAAGPGITVADATSTTKLTPAANGGPALAQTAASARGIHIDLPGGSALDIGAIVQSATASAAGRPGTASAVRSVAMGGVVITAADGTKTDVCQSVCSNVQAAADQLNAAFPGQIEVTLPRPDSPYGPIAQANGIETIPGSPGGYQSAVEPSESDKTLNRALYGYDDSDHETSLLPALRIRVTPPQAENYQLDYLVVDLAPVHVDTFAGVTVSCPDGSYAPDPTDPINCLAIDAGNGNGVTSHPITTPATSGTPRRYVPGTKARFIPGTKGYFVPGTPARTVPGRVAVGAPVTSALLQPAQPPLLAGGIPQLVKRVFHGFRLLARSPAEAAKFFGLLLLLALPMLMAARRRQWTRSVESV